MSCNSYCTDNFPETLNLGVYQGVTFHLVLDWTNNATPPVPINLTGYTASMKIRSGSTVVLELTNGDGITLGGTAGTITLNISADDTATLSGNYQYDLLLTSGSTTTPLIGGTLTVRGS